MNFETPSRLFLVGALLSIASSRSVAIEVSASTTTALSFHYCVAGNTPCDDIVQPALSLVFAGIPGSPTVSASSSVPTIGSAASSIGLSGVAGAPILKAIASSDAGGRVNTTSVALQSYRYTGAVAASRTFGGTLNYAQTLTGVYPGPNGNGVYAGIDVFTLSVAQIEVGTTIVDNFGALIDPSSLPGYHDLGYQDYSDTTSTNAGHALLAVTTTLEPGQTIWVWALLQTPSPNGAVVDASHTLITGWDDTTNLIPAVAVPEPPPGLLGGVGLAALGLWARRRRRAGL